MKGGSEAKTTTLAFLPAASADGMALNLSGVFQ
jgi:hypothetical protein